MRADPFLAHPTRPEQHAREYEECRHGGVTEAERSMSGRHPSCGTRAGYERHKKHKHPPCPECNTDPSDHLDLSPRRWPMTTIVASAEQSKPLDPTVTIPGGEG